LGGGAEVQGQGGGDRVLGGKGDEAKSWGGGFFKNPKPLRGGGVRTAGKEESCFLRGGGEKINTKGASILDTLKGKFKTKKRGRVLH